MKNLSEDIYTFLKGNGFDCTHENVHGCRILYVTIPGKGQRCILPLEISASTPEEADRLAGVVEECLNAIALQDPDGQHPRPVIIVEDRWRSQPEMMQARLLAHLEIYDQIYARNCEVRKIDKKTAGEFLAANHSYGDASCRHRYGLFLKRHTGHVAAGGHETARYPKGTLVAVATFSNARKWTKGDKTIRSYEWTRYASLPGVRLSGGMGKLLQSFIEDVHPDDVMTYADLEWSEGKVYESLGFVFEGVKAPVIFQIDTTAWSRVAIKELDHCPAPQTQMIQGQAFFKNFGSNKYRLKLTEYQ